MAAEFRTPVKTMNPRQKEWFATAMVAMVLADGKLAEGEVESLMRSIGFVDEPGSVERLKKYIQFQTPPPLATFSGWEKLPKNKAAMMLDLMKVAISDRDFSAGEKTKFYEIGNLLGFKRPIIDQLVEAGDNFVHKFD